MNKIIKTLFLSSIILITLSSCNKKEKGESKDVEVEIPVSVVEVDEPVKFTCTYKESAFNKPATRYNKDLSMLSLAYAYSSSNINRLNKFYDDLGFETLYITNNYDDNRSEDYDSYSIGLKEYNGFNLYCVSTRGFAYKEQFSANFELGLEGNAYGFDKNVSIIYQSLKDHIDTTKKTKIWISGYSRAGALMNMLATNILSKIEIDIKEDDLYVYTFEAPSALLTSNVKQYKNIFNIFNSADIVPFVYPSVHEMGKSGVNIDIYNENAAELVNELSPSFIKDDFKPNGFYKNEKELINYLLNLLLNNDSVSEDAKINTREAYVDNYQDGLRYAIVIIYNVPMEVLTNMLNELKNKSLMEMLNTLTPNNLYRFVKGHFDEASVEYDDSRLQILCNSASKLLTKLAVGLLPTILTEIPNYMRVITMHTGEVTYALLREYNKNIK